jgi:hypothetical protein
MRCRQMYGAETAGAGPHYRPTRQQPRGRARPDWLWQAG